MYLNILKRDLKRKKVMNLILFLFIILSSTFVASSINNIYTITTSLDNYLEDSKLYDYNYLLCTINKDNSISTGEFLDNLEVVNNYQIEESLVINPNSIIYNNEPVKVREGTNLVTSIDYNIINAYDMNDELINEVEKGFVYVSGNYLKDNGIKDGDTIKIIYGTISMEFKVKGAYKDAIFSPDGMGGVKLLVNDEDYNYLYNRDIIPKLTIGFINASNLNELETLITNSNLNVIFMLYTKSIESNYTLDMVVAVIILIVSVILILVAFIVLKFIISFTISEEYREIGVMKAIGFKNKNIRLLYIMKYIAISIFGSLLGLFLSIPFGNLLLKDIANIIILNKDNFILINIISTIAVSMIIVLFSYFSTMKVNRLSPIDAIHSGEVGERFKKKGALKLNKSPLKPTSFMSMNDVISSPKRYSIIMIAFSLCTLLLLICSISANTLKSEKLIGSFGMSKSDLYLNEGFEFTIAMDADREKLENEIIRIEILLAENDMPADCALDILLKPSIKYGEYETKVQCYQGIGNKADKFKYERGSAPKLANEIAITQITAEKLNVNIGDTITVIDSTSSKEYIITAVFHTMNNMGEGIRFHEDAMLDYSLCYGCMYFQIDFLYNSTDKEMERRIEKLIELLNTDKIYTPSEFVKMGVGVADTIDTVKNMVLILTIIVIILVTILMEMSFIIKEKNEIAILKAMGFKNFDIIKWHSLRFIFVGIISVAIAIVLSYPVTYFSVTPIFKMMGASFGIEYDIKPLEVYIIYPLICLVTTAIGAIITALYTNKIKASDATSLE